MKKKYNGRYIKKLFKNKKLLFAPWAAEDKFYKSPHISYDAFHSIFKNIIVFDPQKNMLYYGKEGMNKKFLKIIEKEKPDYVFFWLISDEFYIETLLKIKKLSPKTKTINFFGDDDSSFESFTRYYSLIMDYKIISPQLPKKRYKKEGIKNILFTSGVNLKEYKPQIVKKKYDVVFIGTPKADRYNLIKYLKERGIKIKIFGSGWENYNNIKDIYGGKLNNETIKKVFNESKINLCFSKNNTGQPHLKGRFFEVSACRSFSLVEYYEYYPKLFKENEEIVMFKDKEDLLKKIKYYLKNEKEREKIAENVYKKILKRYNLELELKKFFIKIRNDNTKSNLPNIKENIYILKEKDFKSNDNDALLKKIKNIDYIGFNKNCAIFSKYKNLFQIYSLKKSKKEISCCDYYVYSNLIGRYMMSHTQYAYKRLKKKDFNNCLDINQIIITKNYFLKNIEKIKKAYKDNYIDFIDENNTSFIFIPLVDIKIMKKLKYSIIRDVFHLKFMERINTLAYNKKLLSNAYLYKLLIESIKGKVFIIKYILKEKLNRYYLYKLIKMDTINFTNSI